MISYNYISDDLNKFFHGPAADSSADAVLSIAALEDKLVEAISSHNTCEIVENVLYIKWNYLDQAKALIYRINVYDPLPEFVIFSEDIPERLSREFSILDKITREKIIMNAVRRIYQRVDPEYFHTNGIYGKVHWRFDHRP